eukprot:TRINITY_DN7239_c0_g1_i1.p1 TRINITY_DN7239_c0_g1~~TRINITY_DN7239_c0_g1_i1.p1  ORF type:complete len:51 (+),score=10.59 TRINITY_DN7239_c0_g1_i1:82-234(+)
MCSHYNFLRLRFCCEPLLLVKKLFDSNSLVLKGAAAAAAKVIEAACFDFI